MNQLTMGEHCARQNLAVITCQLIVIFAELITRDL